MGIATLIPGLLLPWLVGLAILLAARGSRRPLTAPGEMAWLAGTCYLTGAFVLTLWMRVLSLSGVRFGILTIALPLVVASAPLAWLGWRRGGRALTGATRAALRALAVPSDLSGVARLAWRLLLVWLLLRFLLLGLEVAWQPLYPWDAWIQWATKARVWYELGQIAPFARGDAWFAGNGSVYFDASPEYPPTAPLLQVWACIALGRWDDTLMNWPWWQVAAAMALAMYGGLRSVGVGALAALVGTFFVASLPLANVHVALAGYADLPLAAYYMAAVLGLLRWQEVHDVREAGLAILLALACTQIKSPGVFWALTLVPAFAVALSPRHAVKIAAITFGGALLVLLALARTSVTVFNYRLHLNFDPAWVALGESFFLLGNWHLLWYGALVVAALAWRQLFAPALAPLTTVIAGGVLFLFIVFGFTNARAWVEGQTTVNRATLHFAPIVVVFLVLAFRAFAQHWIATHSEDTPHPSPLPETGARETTPLSRLGGLG